jgi:hypothetical protein
LVPDNFQVPGKEVRVSNDGVPVSELKKLCALTERKRELDREVKEIAGTIAALEESLLGRFAEGDMPKVTVKTDDGNRTVYIRRTIYASAMPEERERLLEVLRQEGMDDFLTYSPQKLSSFVREHEAEERDLPENLAACVKVSEKFKLVVRNA